MGRWGRFVALAVIAFALAGAQQPREHKNGAASANKANQTMTTPAPYAAYPNQNSDACYRAQSHDAADLCAQWRAAVAAEKAAHEARRATNWSIAATFFTLATVIGLIVTIWQTFFALNHARRSNLIAQRANARTSRHSTRALEAAERQNEISSDTAKKQLRAYLAVEPIAFLREADGVKIFTRVKNGGNTPAYEVRFCSAARVDQPAIEEPAVTAIHEHAAMNEAGMVIVSGQALAKEVSVNVTQVQEAACRADTARLYFGGRVHYTDVFGEAHTTWFCHVYHGAEMDGFTYRRGNRAD